MILEEGMTAQGRHQPRTAVCICTANRAVLLMAAVESLVRQTWQPDEIIIVDQSDDLETAGVVAAVETPTPIRYLHLAQKGLSRAYNAALASTSAELLAFTDDDCVAPESWLETVVRCFDEDPEVGLVYGQVLLPPELQTRENVDGVTPSLPIPKRRRMSRRDGFQVFGMGANFAVRRGVLNDLGGFDEVLGGGGPLQSAQDFDLSYRAYRRGHAILLAPEVFVQHYGFRQHSDWPRTVRSYGIGIGGFYAKHLRVGDAYAVRLLAGVILRQTMRASRRTVMRRRARMEWVLLGYMVVGLVRSFRFAIDGHDVLYRPPLPTPS